MNTLKLHRPARYALAAGLALTASTLTLSAVAFAEPATDGRFELAQRGPGGDQQPPDDDKANRKGKREGKQDAAPDQGRGDRGPRGRGGDGGQQGGDRGPRARGGDAGQPGSDRWPRSRSGDLPPPAIERGQRSRGGDSAPGSERGQRSRNAEPPAQVQQQPPPQEQQRERQRQRQAPQQVEPQQPPQQVQPQQRMQQPQTGQQTSPTRPLANEPSNPQGAPSGSPDDRRFRGGGGRPGAPANNAGPPPADTAPANTQRTAPTTIQRLETAPDGRRDAGPRDADSRDRNGGNTFRRGDNNNPGAREPAGDYKRWRSERRQEEQRGGFANIDALKSARKERQLKGGGMIIEEPDSRRIIRNGDRSYIIRDETRRMRRYGDVSDARRRPGGGNITTIVRPDGVRIVTETSPDGRLIRRYRRTRDGRDIILVDNRRTWRKWGAIGAGAVLATGLILALDPPHYRGPRERYIIDYDRASYDDVYDALLAPPIDDIGPRYTLDQVLFNYNLRERMRRVDLDSINFDTGAWDIDEGQFGKLEHLARAIDRILDRNPDEVFLIEGHTDAVGDPVSNRSLSDRRAEEVANILTEEFRVPPENLVIQGYGEEFLKVPTDGPSRINRRVTVRRITPLLDRRNMSSRD